MGSYENLVKTEKIRKKVDEGDFLFAQNILDTMDLKKVKNISDLNLLAEVYKENERYDEAAELYLRIYQKSKTRKTLSQLVNISIKRGNIDEAQYYLEQYREIAPDDFDGYIYQYKIDKLKGASYEQLISALESLKKKDYTEKWAYELAKLYFKAGMEDQCIRECSDIILWFGEGIYVEKAKMLRSYFSGEADREKMIREIKFRPEPIKDKQTYDASEEPEDVMSNEVYDANDIYEETEDIMNNQNFDANDVYEETEDIMYNQTFDANDAYEETEDDMGSQTYEANDTYEETEMPENSVINKELEEDKSANITLGSDEKKFLDELKMVYQNMLSKEENIEFDKVKYAEDHTEDAETDQVKQKIYEEDESAEQDNVELKDKQVKESGLISEDITEEDKKLNDIADKYHVNPEDIFGDFLKTDSIKKQLMKSIEYILQKDTETVLMVLIGPKNTDKIGLAKDIALFMNKVGKLNSSKVAKITAEKLNKVNIEAKKDTLKDCCLVIEEAQELNNTTIDSLLELIKQLKENIAVIFHTDNRNLHKLLRGNPDLMNLLHNRIYLLD